MLVDSIPASAKRGAEPSDTVRVRRNQIIGAIPRIERAAVWETGEEVEVPAGTTIVKRDENYEYVYFPETLVFSLITDLKDANSVESGTVGYEGFLGLPVFLGSTSSLQRVIVQVPGKAWRIPAGKFLELLPDLPHLRDHLNSYTLAYISQISQTAACNSQHSIMQRAARWMMLTHDRAGNREFPLTQQFLSYMLGVRRSSVAVSQADLKAKGLITYTRGRMRIIDLDGLEAVACECQSVVRGEFTKLTGAAVG